jgi:hypothetical protein
MTTKPAWRAPMLTVGERPQRWFPKVIDGALDLMPAAPTWDEAEYVEWLTYFDKACRLYYRLPRTIAESLDTVTPPNRIAIGGEEARAQ